MFRRLIDFARRPKVRRFLLFAGVASVIIGAPIAYKAHDYIQNDPSFCTSCHIMDDAFDRWSHSGHKDVNCHTCHPGDIASNLHQVWVTFTTDQKTVKKHAEVSPEICGQCHLSNDPKWKQIAETAGHKLHYGQLGVQCVTCHAAEIHQFRPTDEMCKGCHYTQTVGLTAMQRNHCTSCHNFLAPASEGLRPSNEKCGECHAQGLDGAPALATGWHEGVTCGDCHPVHDPRFAANEDAPTRDGAARPCVECHDDVPDPTFVFGGADLKGRPRATTGLPGVGHDRCDSCHVPHSAVAPVERCRDCHADAAARLPVDGPHVCTDCHVAHEPDVDPRGRCDDCHRDTETLARETPVAAHRDCTSCHEAHAPSAPRAPACATCHVDEARLARAGGPAAHQECAGCHKVHAPESPRRCANCHGEPTAADAPPAHRDCDNCHKPHGSPLAGEAKCAECHAKPAQQAALGPPEHARCRDCHTAHDPRPVPKDTCGACHTVTADAPHADCTSCHPRHDRRPPAAICASCHEDKVHRGVPAGHADCTGCHAPHRVSPDGACANCHAAPVAGVRSAAVAEHRECASCHGDAHGRAKPSCADCHAAEVGGGLHAVEAHRDCAGCHGDHPPRPAPARVCLDCHDMDRIARHPPEARGVTTCSGCHNFRGKGEGR
jgi:nitrate/TMAO reductase-like tetraheme cytochrome c subunit